MTSAVILCRSPEETTDLPFLAAHSVIPSRARNLLLQILHSASGSVQMTKDVQDDKIGCVDDDKIACVQDDRRDESLAPPAGMKQKRQPHCCNCLSGGGDRRIRTDDPLLAKQVL